MKPAHWIAPALAVAIGLVPAMAVEQQPGGENQAQQQEITPIDEQRLVDLERTGTLLIVDLDAKDKQEAVDKQGLSFEEAWQDRSLKEDVDQDVRYVVFYSKDADQQKQQAARDAFEQSGYHQINYYYVLDESAIKQLEENRKQSDAGAMGAEDDLQAQDWESQQDDGEVAQASDLDPLNDKRVAGIATEGKSDNVDAQADGEVDQIQTEEEVDAFEGSTAARSDDQPKAGQYEGRYQQEQN